MKAIMLKQFGGPENFFFGDSPKPSIGENDLLIKVAATSLNRADILQRKGLYPPPPGESDILGLEMSGTIVEIGATVKHWKIGDQVCGLLAGGGYAEYVKINEEMAMPLPEGLSVIEAAALPEVFLTAFQAIRWLGKLKSGETVLIHAGASGVGTAAIQLSKVIGAKVIVTASKAKHSFCKQLGADHTIDYKSEDFTQVVNELTNQKGVNLIIDFIGAPYFQKNIDSLGMEGRLVMLGFLGGTKLESANLGRILFKRLQVVGSTLRARDLAYKIALTKDLKAFAWPLFETKKLKPIIDSIYDWDRVEEAHQKMERNENIGKIVLKVSK